MLGCLLQTIANGDKRACHLAIAISQMESPFTTVIRKPVDATSMIKGMFIDELLSEVQPTGKYLIDFGGDIVTNGRASVEIEGSNLVISTVPTSRPFYIFTSGNTDKRGDHIKGGGRGTVTVISREFESATVADMYTTQRFAGGIPQDPNRIEIWRNEDA